MTKTGSQHKYPQALKNKSPKNRGYITLRAPLIGKKFVGYKIKESTVMNYRAFFIILIVAIGLLWLRAMELGA